MTNNDFFMTLGGIALAFIAILAYAFGFTHAGTATLVVSLAIHASVLFRFATRHGRKPDTLRSAT